jgi:dTDP-4-dehydrorhamnose reductase
MKILILGSYGMLGNAILTYLSQYNEYELFGTVRTVTLYKANYYKIKNIKIIGGVDVENNDKILEVFNTIRPEIVINCVGIIKQSLYANNIIQNVSINSLLPHRLYNCCRLIGARFIHFSTDCVFSGTKGMYIEDDIPNASDLYGRTKYIGEVKYENSITLRTSIIGHEIYSNRSLLSWFLSQEGEVLGYRKAIFSGLPVNEIAYIIKNIIFQYHNLSGLYHLSAEPINKFQLLNIIAEVYKKNILIKPDDNLVIDRSLDSTLFNSCTGYVAPKWPDLINQMYEFNKINAT